MKKQRILIAEDDANFGMMLESYLSVNGFDTTLCSDGNKALATYKSQDFDLCVFDVMMPYRDGFSLVSEINKMNKRIPFIFLTAKAMKEDQVKGYLLGAMDYLIKPFDPEILLFKVKAILSQKSSSQSKAQDIFSIGNFTFNTSHRLLTLDDWKIKLSPKESQLLHLLAINMGNILTREEALIKIWKETSLFTTKSMDVYITKLRKHLRQDEAHIITIDNLHSKGFVMSVKKL